MFFNRLMKKIKNRNSKRKATQRVEIPKERMCSECEYSEFYRGRSLASCGYICKLDPKNPIGMGFRGQHSMLFEEQNNNT